MREVKNNPNPLNPYAQEEIIEQNSGGTVIYSTQVIPLILILINLRVTWEKSF